MQDDVTATAERVRQVTKEFILQEFLPGARASELTRSTPLISGGIIDSIAMIRLVSHLEDHFSVRFEPHELGADSMDTLDLVAETVASKVK